MKKILFVPYTFTMGGGAEKILSLILSHLPQNKYDITLIELVHSDKGNEELPTNVRELRPLIDISQRNIWNKFRNNIIIFLLYFLPSTVRLLLWSKERYDIVVSFNYLTPSIFASTFPSRKKISWVHGSIEDLDYRHYKNIWKKIKIFIFYFAQKRVFKKTDAIVVVSKKTYDSVINIFPFAEHKTRIIYNGFNFEQLIKNSSLKTVNKSKLRIIALGRLEEQKNFSLIINSANILKSKLDFELLILGDGDIRTELQELITKLKIDDVVKLMGYVKNPYPYILSSDVICVSSYSEGFPTVIAEGMILGVPFVSTNVGGASELSCGNTCGLITGSSTEEYAAAIFQLLSNNKLRGEMSNKCKREIRKYSIENQIEIIQQLFDI